MAAKSTGSQKLYRNSGITDLVFEGQTMEPGSEFTATLTPEHEQQLLIGGHIEILRDQSTQADEAQAKAAEDAETGGRVVAELDVEAPRASKRDRRSS